LTLHTHTQDFQGPWVRVEDDKKLLYKKQLESQSTDYSLVHPIKIKTTWY